ncbi:MAG: MFS transporter [Labedaea sp.]
MLGWAVFADVVPLYSLYALLFADSGLSAAKISVLFMIWSATGFLAEVPSGALADRFSRRGALVVAGVGQAAGYAVWVLVPSFTGFAAGFVLWGLGGALVTGALEALLYDGMVAADAAEHYPRVYGWVEALRLLAQVPAAVAATVLFGLGGYDLVGWASVACCLVAAALAARLPEAPGSAGPAEDEPAGYLATLRAGVLEAAGNPAVRAVLVAAAVLAAVDGIEEYFTLLAADWGVPPELVPVAVLGIPLAGAAGATFGGPAARLHPVALGVVLGVAATVFGGTGLLRHPAGLAGVAVFYGLYRMVLVVVDARLQQRIEGPARATVTSVAGLGTEVTNLLLFAAWAVGQVMLVAALMVLLATVLPRWLAGPRRR